jgi:hypothetical protein
MMQIQTPSVYRVSLMTPYLTEQLSSIVDPIEVMQQLSRYGFDPSNLSGVSSLSTDGGNVVALNKPGADGFFTPRLRGELLRGNLIGSDLVIAGSARGAEREVGLLRDSGLVFGRYSIFYGSPSGYTGRTPTEGGYSLDIPKTIGAVRALISSDDVLESLRSRDSEQIRQSIEQLNERNSPPILVTPFLEEALSR